MVVVIIIVVVLAFVITTIIFALVFFVKGSLLTDIFTGVALEIVTATFAIGYLSEPGVGMALGRRWCTHSLFGAGMPIIVKAPTCVLSWLIWLAARGTLADVAKNIRGCQHCCHQLCPVNSSHPLFDKDLLPSTISADYDRHSPLPLFHLYYRLRQTIHSCDDPARHHNCLITFRQEEY